MSKEWNPTVSVVIPTYNRAKLVGRAIQSVLNQTYQDFEIIVIDDGSTDNTEEVVKSFNDEKIKYIRHKGNKGGSAARNTGIKLAKGEYIAFLDSDDEWLPSKIEKQLNTFQNDNIELGLVYTGIYHIFENQKINKKQLIKRYGNLFPDILTENYVGTTSTIMVKKYYLDKINYFDESFISCQDWDLYIRLGKICKFNYVDDYLVRYYHSDCKYRIFSDKNKVIFGHDQIYKKYKKDYDELSNKNKGEYFNYVSTIFISINALIPSIKMLIKAFNATRNLIYLLYIMKYILISPNKYLFNRIH